MTPEELAAQAAAQAAPAPGRTVKMEDGRLTGIDTWLQASGFGGESDNEPAPKPAPAIADPVEDVDDSNAEEPPVTPAVKKIKLKVQGQELEVPESELTTLAQMGIDYTQKTQRLAERERALAPMEGVLAQIQKDPTLRGIILDYWNTGKPPAAAQPKPAIDPAKANDPVEILKAEIIDKIRSELLPEVQQHTARTVQQAVNTGIAPITQEVAIAQTMQKVMTDPMYLEVQQSLGAMVKGLPPEIGQKVFTELDTNPDVYMKTYLQHREKLVAQKKATAGGGAPNQPVTSRNQAPLLESSGQAPAPQGNEARKKRTEKAKAAMLRNGDVNALSEWLQASGALDHIRLDDNQE